MPQDNPTLGDDLEARYEIVEGLISKGLEKRHVVQFVRDHDDELGWNLSDRQVRNYYDTVMQRMAEGAALIDRRQYHVRSLGRLDYIYRTAIEAHDRKHALAAEQTIIRLLKLDSPEAAMDWRKVAEQAGLDADSILEQMLKRHAEMDAVGHE